MKDWKDQLRKIVRAMRPAGPVEKHDDKSKGINFVPPKSWIESTPPESGVVPELKVSPTQANKSPGGIRATSRLQPSGKQSGRETESKIVASPTTFKPQISGSQSLTMPDWAQIGSGLQHPKTRGGAPLLVRLGIDFGTAFTKAAFRAGPDLVAVDWSPLTGDDSPAGCWVVPGLVCRGPGGEFGLRSFRDGEWQSNFKLPLVESELAVVCPFAALAYLAEVIRYSRAFLYRHPEVGRKLASRSLRWEFNLGCPTQPHENPKIVERFGHVARTAWWLAGCDHLDEAVIQKAWDSRELNTKLETQPGVVPEFVAQIAGYLKSSQVAEGLHALVDVGAATLDVATFNVVLPKGDTVPRIPIFFSAVEQLGTHFLSRERHARLGLELNWNDALPIEPAPEFAHQHEKEVTAVKLIDEEFTIRITNCITHVIKATLTNTRGDPRSAAWREGLPVFVTGGGSVCEIYSHAIRQCESNMGSAIRWNEQFRLIEMDLNQVTSINVDFAAAIRLTVAIGLTEDTEDIARIVPHRNIEPITETVRAPRPDRDELYPK